MLIRSAVVLTLGASLAGCANDAPNLASFASTPSALAIATPAVAGVAEPLTTESVAFRKTMSDRVLAAIALERVTGLKPDPSRLAD